MTPTKDTPPTLATAVEVGYQAWLWFDARVADFPAPARRQLGHRVLDAILDGLVATVEATYLPRGPRRVGRLQDANRSLALARILLRGARDRRYIGITQHEHGMRLLDHWGRQLGGWLRAESQDRRHP